MYDIKSEPHEFVGADRADAVAQAVRFFGVEEEELRVKEPAEGEIAGVGVRSVIVAVPKNVTPQPREEARGGEERSRGPGRERGRENRHGRGRERERRPERDREAEPERTPEPMVAEDEADEAESRATIKGTIGPIGEFIVGVMERMRIGPFEISEVTEGSYLVYALSGPAAEKLGAGDGRGSEAIQLLANQAAMRGSEDAPRIVVDAAGDVARREENLGRLVDRASKRAKESKRSVALEPMNPADRRALHMAVREVDGVVTMSVGEGRYRQVVIVPEGAPEYEEACDAAAKVEAERQE